MRTHRLAVVLTVVNLALLTFSLMRGQPTAAQEVGPEPRSHVAEVAPVLRGRALEIVDARGRVRASIQVQSAGPAPGVPYTETVILRLSTPDGKPRVKIATGDGASGLSFVGETDSAHVILKAEGPSASLKLANRDGQVRLITP